MGCIAGTVAGGSVGCVAAAVGCVGVCVEGTVPVVVAIGSLSVGNGSGTVQPVRHCISTASSIPTASIFLFRI